MKWTPSPPLLVQPRDDVHVWKADLAEGPASLDLLTATLSDAERGRVDRFRFAEDSRRYAASHTMLRAVLGRYLAVEPAVLNFSEGPHGKPSLLPGRSPLRFNLSHAGSVAMLAVTTDRDVGIDVERVRMDLAADDIGTRFFHAQERALLASLEPASRIEAFFVCWTRKEAFLKGRGLGLSGGLDRFDVSRSMDAPPAAIEVDDVAGGTGRWQIVDLPIDEGYRAAVAVKGSGREIVRWEFDWRSL